MKIKYTIIFTSIVILFIATLAIACSKEITNVNEETQNAIQSIMTNGNDPEVESFFLLNLTQVANVIPNANNNTTINAAAVIKEDGNFIDAGTISINGRPIEKQASNIYTQDYTDSLFFEGKNLEGTEIDINISGNTSNSIITTQKKTYVPKLLITDPYDMPVSHIDKSAGFNLKWQPDPLNVTGKIYIQVFYYSGISKSINPNYPSSIASHNLIVSDNGNYRLPPSVFNNYPTGTYLGIIMGRGTEYIQNVKLPMESPKNVHFFNIVQAKTIPLVVLD
jgi:hypothetical protein